MPRHLLLLLIGALCAGAAFLITEPDPDALIEREAARLQQHVAEAEVDLVDLAALHARALSTGGAVGWMSGNARALEAERLRSGITVLAYVGDSLVAWSGDPPFAPAALVDNNTAQLAHGSSFALHARVDVGTLNVHVLRPLWISPPIVNRYLQENFHPSLDAARGLVAETSAGIGPVIEDVKGQVLFRLAWREGAVEMGGWLLWRAALLALTALFVLAGFWVLCMRVVHSGKPLAGTVVFVCSALLLRTVTLLWGSTAPMDRWPLFDPAVYAASAAFPSLGDLLINAALLVVLCAFLWRALRDRLPVSSVVGVALFTAAVLLHAAWVTDLCIGLVNDSSIDLDLYHVQSVGAFGVAALFIMGLLLASWCLVAHAAVSTVWPNGGATRTVLVTLAMLVGSIVLHHINGVVDTVLFLWPVPVIALFVLAPRGSLTFLNGVLAIAMLATISTHILTKYTHSREQRERVVLAERLAAREDPVVEQLFREEAPQLRRDTAIYRLLTSRSVCGPGELESVVRQPHFSGYWERYDIRLFGFGPDGAVRCATDLDPPRGLDAGANIFPSGISDMPDLHINERSEGDLFYHARIAVMPNDSAPPAQLIVELQPRSLSQGLGFPELLLAGDDAIARRAERYAQARYVNGLLMDQGDRTAQPQRWSGALNGDGERWYNAGGYHLLAKAVGSSTIMVLGLPQRGIVDKATTFSYLFTFFGTLALLALAFHALLTRSLPSLGIGTKVRAALVLFAITGLLFFATGTQRLLTRQFTQRAETASLEKARSVRLELQRRLGDERITGAANTAYLEHLLGQLSNTYFTDITVYAPDGEVLASSRPQMFSSGLLGQRMNPVAYARIAIDGRSTLVHEEQIGEAEYRTAYLPLLDRKGDVLAHIALPSFADQVQQEEERSELLVAVVNLFVLLFALSVLLAVFISNWTTRPLDLLKRALAGVALQGANEPIRYKGKDEVGELVAVYNRKVDELRESAEKLARSERESAWKEMARQVAHEIKNPLTPMKLGIQHFQRSWDPSAPGAKDKLDRFSTSMVEQIDALSRVAGDFSRFAQMSAAHEVVLDLNEVAKSAVALLAGEPNADITLHLPSSLMVKADREHLLRVFNNLLKNALQAIPDERRGKIEVVLRSEGGNALVEVRDNGTGIPEDVREHIFEPSFTTKSSGTGLGLAMVKRMVEGAGGRVWFTTQAGEGTTFSVSLPLHR